MAITTLDQVIAGLQIPRHFVKAATGTLVAGRPSSYWALAGAPGAGGYDATLNGAVQTAAVNGQMPRTNPGAGNAHVARLSAVATIGGMLLLCDRLWQNRPANSSGAQAITSPTWPARDAAGSTNGDGVQLALEISTASTAGTPTCPITYTNQANAGSKTANLLDAITATTAIGSFLRYDLTAGDTGVRSVQSFNASGTLTSGVWNIVAYRVLAALEIVAGGIANAADALTLGMPRVFDSSVLFWVFVPSTTTATAISGSYIETQG